MTSAVVILGSYISTFTEDVSKNLHSTVPEVVKGEAQVMYIRQEKYLWLQQVSQAYPNRTSKDLLDSLASYISNQGGEEGWHRKFQIEWIRLQHLQAESEVVKQAQFLDFLNKNIYRVIFSALMLLVVGFFYRLFRYHLRFQRYYTALHNTNTLLENAGNPFNLQNNPDKYAKILAILNPSHIDIGTFKHTPADPFPDLLKTVLTSTENP